MMARELWFLLILLTPLFLAPPNAVAAVDNTELTDPASDHDSRVVILTPLSRSVVAPGAHISFKIALTKPLKGENDVSVTIYRVPLKDERWFTLRPLAMPHAARQPDGNYLAEYIVPPDFTGKLWILPDVSGDGFFSSDYVGKHILIDVKPAK